MMETVTAQREDEVGKLKIGKSAESMNRDWKAFYNPIFGSEMANYADSAAKRIEKETREEMWRKARTESLQDDSRRSSTEGSDASATSIEIILVDPKNGNSPKKTSEFCIKVNKPGGCLDASHCGAESHTNAGKQCRNGDKCKFGAGRCAWIHDAFSGTGSVPPSPTPPRGGSVRGIDLTQLDLLDPQILLQALADLTAFKVCAFVNKPQGCKSKAKCRFNYSLTGFPCEEYRNGHCSRDYDWVLFHEKLDPTSEPPLHTEASLKLLW